MSIPSRSWLMSAIFQDAVSSRVTHRDEKGGLTEPKGAGDYKGFVGGVASAVAKWSIGHPFDTIKVRLQTAPRSQFAGPIDCVLQTARKEGINGFYKGATPPLLGWVITDSLTLGSLIIYRRLLNEHFFQTLRARPSSPHTWTSDDEKKRLPTIGHFFAGMLSGWTVTVVAGPIEHVKARLQTQYSADKAQRLYSGPVDCTRKLLQQHGLRGVWHGFVGALLFRTFFSVLWGSYDYYTRLFERHTSLSTPATNFWAGGLSAQTFWLTAFPLDVVKQRYMTDSADPDKRKHRRWRDAAKAVWTEAGWKGYWRGCAPCFLRALPANGAALVVFESVMRSMG